MIGRQKSQLSILDGAFNGRKKRCRSDALIEKINDFVNWNKLVQVCQGIYKDSKRGRPIPRSFRQFR